MAGTIKGLDNLGKEQLRLAGYVGELIGEGGGTVHGEGGRVVVRSPSIKKILSSDFTTKNLTCPCSDSTDTWSYFLNFILLFLLIW